MQEEQRQSIHTVYRMVMVEDRKEFRAGLKDLKPNDIFCLGGVEDQWRWSESDRHWYPEDSRSPAYGVGINEHDFRSLANSLPEEKPDLEKYQFTFLDKAAHGELPNLKTIEWAARKTLRQWLRDGSGPLRFDQ